MDSVEAVVIGAGVVGLAVGRALARSGFETIVLERANAIGTGTSSRNSEVIHAGIYYPAGSLKARLCVQGRTQLYAFCDSHGVSHRRCGKLVVATSPQQHAALQDTREKAAANGVALSWLDADAARALEPALSCSAALLSPETGIVDSHGLMLALQGDLERHGGALALQSPVLGVQCGSDAHVVEVGGEMPISLSARIVVNAAGLWAPGLAAAERGLPGAQWPQAFYAKGNYFSLAGRAPFGRLIYPVPEQAGLGVHLTLDLAGQARFGPDVQWLETGDPDAIDYRVDPARAEGFYAEIRRYWPGLRDGALQPAYSGVRPKLQGPGAPAGDFVLQGPAEHGVRGLLNLFGIESPGLTASLALADEVLRRLGIEASAD
ncbi:NAD(P)/FAD-dependent oxidoreductase [Piscinibacter sp.]|uniref:NAD(P)/FAD-dependent oxidoreductase n=1 Tax=Piscinibacter sp. TaxID=1903157 RepID=UPI001E02EB68|nr:NAD(P)/FAD-dependent oxidoreductase [Piscinibacter sp.]MBK7529144.1 NAD(P)/FAD-dependent oxidoreductase [Piscinibacter sp.]MBL0093831.1 NAD(P)/FAD-dependent oxidoreductase [Piscinibacter sp.]HNW62428.1 NAD(P)/FAD-dependent oxidoreductase [Piscinibacter sp.]